MLTKLSRTDEVVMQPTEEVPDDADALSPFIGLANGLLAAVVVCALLGAGVLAAYQLAPSWVAATVRSVLLARLPSRERVHDTRDGSSEQLLSFVILRTAPPPAG